MKSSLTSLFLLAFSLPLAAYAQRITGDSSECILMILWNTSLLTLFQSCHSACVNSCYQISVAVTRGCPFYSLSLSALHALPIPKYLVYTKQDTRSDRQGRRGSKTEWMGWDEIHYSNTNTASLPLIDPAQNAPTSLTLESSRAYAQMQPKSPSSTSAMAAFPPCKAYPTWRQTRSIHCMERECRHLLYSINIIPC